MKYQMKAVAVYCSVVVHMEYCSVFYLKHCSVAFHIVQHSVVVCKEYCSVEVQISTEHLVHIEQHCVVIHTKYCSLVVQTECCSASLHIDNYGILLCGSPDID